jgi:cell division protein FtsB
MTLREEYARNPFNWKDVLAVAAFAVTIATMVWQGGRLVEKQEAISQQITTLNAQLQAMQGTQTIYSTELARLRGKDDLHDEQIRRHGQDLEDLKRRR